MRRYLRSLATNCDGAAAVARAKLVRWQRKPRVDDELLAVFWFGELEQENAGGQIVDIGQAEGDKAVGELVGNYMHVQGRESLLHVASDGSRGVLNVDEDAQVVGN